MRKIVECLEHISLGYLLSLVLVLLFFSIAQDLLLFKTNFSDLVQFLLATAFLFFLGGILPLILGAHFISDVARNRSMRLLQIIIFTLIIFGFFLSLLDKYRIFPSTIKRFNEISIHLDLLNVFLIGAVGLLILSWRITRSLSKREDFFARISQIALAIGLAGICYMFLFSVKQKIASVFIEEPDRKNLVLVVLDGLSTKYLSTYNPSEITPAWDQVASKGIVFTNFRTNFTYTSGFFTTIYSGKRRPFPGLVKGQPGLINALQERGVQTRWFSFHNNGVPDILESPYKGLRSAILSSALTWYPQFLGMDYNVFESDGGGKGRGRPMGYRQSLLQNWVARFYDNSHVNPLQGSVLNEIENLREDGRPFFFLVHLPFNALTAYEEDPKLWEIEKDKFVPKNKIQTVQKTIYGKQDYTYTDKEAWVVKFLRQKYRQGVKHGTNSLQQFLEVFREKKWNRDTCVIITADHGKIFSKGKVAYGFHNEEEVTRVPLLVFCNGQTGVDDRLGESVDIVQTIREFFGVAGTEPSNAVSLFLNAPKKWVPSLTTRSEKRKEWFLNVYEGSNKYVFNVYPKNFEVRRERFANYFDTVTEDKGPEVLTQLNFDPRKILTEYQVQPIPPELE